MPATLTTEAAAAASPLSVSGEADTVEQLAERRRMLDTDKPGALVDQLLEAAFVGRRRGGHRGDVATDGSPDHPDQPAHHQKRREQRQRPRQAKVDDRWSLDGIGERVDHVPERQRQHERQQQPTPGNQQVHRGCDHDCPQSGTLQSHVAHYKLKRRVVLRPGIEQPRGSQPCRAFCSAFRVE